MHAFVQVVQVLILTQEKKLLFKQVYFNMTTTDRKERFLGSLVDLTFLASLGSGKMGPSMLVLANRRRRI